MCLHWGNFGPNLQVDWGILETVLVQYGTETVNKLMNYLSAHLHQCWSNTVTQPWMGLVTNAPFGCQSWSNIVNQPWDICPKTVLYQGCYPVLGRFGKQHWTNIDPNINVSFILYEAQIISCFLCFRFTCLVFITHGLESKNAYSDCVSLSPRLLHTDLRILHH